MTISWLSDVPQEIRLKIYHFLFSEPDRILVYRPLRDRKYTHDCSETVGLKRISHPKLPLAIIRTRKEVRLEAEPIFYNENVFQICPGCCWPSPASVVGLHNYLSMHSIQLPSRFVFNRLDKVSTGIFGRGAGVNTAAYGKIQYLEIHEVKSLLDTKKGGRISSDDDPPPRSELFLHNLLTMSRDKVEVLVFHYTEPFFDRRNHGFDHNLDHEEIEGLRPCKMEITNTPSQQYIHVETTPHETYNVPQREQIIRDFQQASILDKNVIWNFDNDD